MKSLKLWRALRTRTERRWKKARKNRTRKRWAKKFQNFALKLVFCSNAPAHWLPKTVHYELD